MRKTVSKIGKMKIVRVESIRAGLRTIEKDISAELVEGDWVISILVEGGKMWIRYYPGGTSATMGCLR